MATGDLLTAEWQVELREVLMSAGECDQALVVTEWLDGFGVPDTRNADVNRAMRHGVYASPQYLGPRAMTMAVAARGADYDELLAAQVDLGTAWGPVDDADADLVVPLAFTLGDPATKYVVYGKPLRAAFGYKTLLRVHPHMAFTEAALCEFLATDPRIYTLAEQTESLSLGVSSGGHGFPLGFPHGFGTATSGAADCVNAGNIDTYPVITVSAGGAGASAIALENTTTGESWEIVLTLAAGETLVVDMGEQTALLNGTASREPFVVRPPSVWWALQPGSNQVQLVATGAGTTAVVAWHDAYLI